MAKFFTADIHDQHDKVAELRGFKDAADMRQEIELNWRDAITGTDEVYILGDLAVKSTWTALKPTLDWLQSLPGWKHLILGNHDPAHPMNYRTHRKLWRGYGGTFRTLSIASQVRIGTEQVLLSHFPYHADREEFTEPRHAQWRLPDHGQWLLHGHTHSKERLTSDHEIHVGLDAWEMYPVHEHEVLALMDKARQTAPGYWAERLAVVE